MRPSLSLYLEWLFAVCIAACLIWHAWFLNEFGYLAPPFFYAPSATFMDWFATTIWSYDEGRYDNWQTLYPPLSFSLTRLLSVSTCYTRGTNGDEVRDCDWLGYVGIGTFFTINTILTLIALRRIDRTTAWPRWFALSFGLPMIYGFERGNLLLPTFTFLLIAFTPLVRSARLRWLALGMAINMKVYLVSMLFPQLLKRRWRWFEGALVFTVLVYVGSYLHIGNGSPREVVDNLVAVSGPILTSSFLDGWYAMTYAPFMGALQSDFIPIVGIIGSDAVEGLLFLLPLLQRLTQALIALAALAVWLRPEAVPMTLVTLLGLLMALVTQETGGYTGMFLLLFVFMQRWEGIGRPIAIIMCYILAIPGDIIIDRLAPAVDESFLSGGTVSFQYALILGPFIRPLLVQITAVSIAASVISMVRRDFAANPGGWRQRFAKEPLAAR